MSVRLELIYSGQHGYSAIKKKEKKTLVELYII